MYGLQTMAYATHRQLYSIRNIKVFMDMKTRITAVIVIAVVSEAALWAVMNLVALYPIVTTEQVKVTPIKSDSSVTAVTQLRRSWNRNKQM